MKKSDRKKRGQANKEQEKVRQKESQADRMDGLTNARSDDRRERLTDKQMDGPTDRHTTDRLTDSE